MHDQTVTWDVSLGWLVLANAIIFVLAEAKGMLQFLKGVSHRAPNIIQRLGTCELQSYPTYVRM